MMISVVIPLYNKRNSIASTIESVLGQTYGDFELIVVDDGSTDGSAEVVRVIHDSRIRLIEKTNVGVSSARNVGVMAASSEYVAFLDGDDLWERGFLSEIVGMIQDFPGAGIWGTSYSFLKSRRKEPAEKPLPQNFYGLIDNSSWNLGHLYCSTAVCCKKAALLEIGLFDERIAYGEDTDVWWRIMLRYPAAYSNKPLAVYRFDEENRAMERHMDLEKLYVFYFEKYAEDRKNNAAFRHFIDKECMWWLYPYLLTGEKTEEVARILSNINFSEYKFSFRFRFKHPKLYEMVKKIK